jgi:hypothetical protein
MIEKEVSHYDNGSFFFNSKQAIDQQFDVTGVSTVSLLQTVCPL